MLKISSALLPALAVGTAVLHRTTSDQHLHARKPLRAFRTNSGDFNYLNNKPINQDVFKDEKRPSPLKTDNSFWEQNAEFDFAKHHAHAGDDIADSINHSPSSIKRKKSIFDKWHSRKSFDSQSSSNSITADVGEFDREESNYFNDDNADFPTDKDRIAWQRKCDKPLWTMSLVVDKSQIALISKHAAASGKQYLQRYDDRQRRSTNKISFHL